MGRVPWRANLERKKKKTKPQRKQVLSLLPAKQKDKENREWLSFRGRQLTYSLFSIKLLEA